MKKVVKYLIMRGDINNINIGSKGIDFDEIDQNLLTYAW